MQEQRIYLGSDMNQLTIVLLVFVLLSGCASTPHDRSTGEETALIESQDKFWSRCSIYGPLPVELRELEPPTARDFFGIFVGIDPFASTSNYHDSLVVDAGSVKIVTRCVAEDPFGGSVNYNARFSFIAEAGHTYNFSGKNSDCYKLLDVTDGGRVVACEPYFRGFYDDLSTGNDVATFVTTGGPYSEDFCLATKGSVWQSRGLLEFDAGPITVDAICEKKGWWKDKKMISSFDFVAAAGHTYRFTASDKNCMRLIDLTAGGVVIACEPYEEVK